LIGVLTVTSYRPTPSQTRPECHDRWDCDTAEGDGVTRHGIAVSRDVARENKIGFGDVLCVETLGCRVVNDTMGPKAKKAVDLMVFTRHEEKRIGTRHLKVYKLEVSK
jgi:3D (Asp-Asp-Asp) domain-containing protein